MLKKDKFEQFFPSRSALPFTYVQPYEYYVRDDDLKNCMKLSFFRCEMTSYTTRRYAMPKILPARS